MNKELRRILELAGRVDKSDYISSLYENYQHDGESRSGFEGPFKMDNGRVVHYNVSEGRFYDAATQIVLTASEQAQLTETDSYDQVVTLSAKRGEESVTLRLEGMMEMRPMVSMLRNNGYEDFDAGADVDMDALGGAHPDGAMVRRQMDTMKDNLERLCKMVDDGTELPAWVQAKVTIASENLDTVTDYLDGASAMDPDDVDMPDADMAAMPMEGETQVEEDAAETVEESQEEINEASKADLQKQIDALVKQRVMIAGRGKRAAVQDKIDALKGKMAKLDEADTSEKFSKGQEVMYKGKKVTVKVPDGPTDLVGVDHGDGKVDMVKASELSMAEKVDEGQQTFGAWKAALRKKFGSDVEFEGDKDIAQAFVTKDGKKRGVGEWDGAEGRVDEDAVSAVYYDNDAMPADAVDDMEQKAERTGQADRTGTPNKVPREVMAALDKRVRELKASIERYDNTGYNDKSVKVNAVEALEQIKTNLGRGDQEGFIEANIFYNTLMSPITDMFPGQVVNYLVKGSETE